MRRRDPVAAYAAALASWDLDNLSDFVAEDVRADEPSGSFRGLDELTKRLRGWKNSYPEGVVETLDLIGEGDRVAWKMAVGWQTHLGQARRYCGHDRFRGRRRPYKGVLGDIRQAGSRRTARRVIQA